MTRMKNASTRAGGGSRRLAMVIGLAATLLVAPLGARAADDAAAVGRESGLGAASALSSLIYAPVKLVYATGGLVVGAFAWVFTAGDTEVASKVFTRSLRGTYVITPEILLGEERLEFIGQEVDEAPRAEAVASAGPTRAPAYSVAPRASTSDPVDDRGYGELGW